MTKKRILVAPMDWGLGHATRCIPIIRYLIEKNCEVVIGTSGRPLDLLKKEFPSLEFILIPSYNISYPKNGSMVVKMARQIPKILKGIKQEHIQLEKIISGSEIDAVISDNRFGLWNENVPCVFITHQIMIKSPLAENFIRKKNWEYIAKFSECWVPDVKNGLSGDLGNKFQMPSNRKFIGLLSRFNTPLNPLSRREIRELLVILSGPEPQRTIFEKKILEQLAFLKLKVLIVQGITEKDERKNISRDVEIVSHLTSKELEKEILSSQLILSRPGYTSIMDLAILRKKAIFVPTPGQTEQEYLAKKLRKEKIAYSVSQKKFDLTLALRESENYSGFAGSYPREEFKKAVDDLILSLK